MLLLSSATWPGHTTPRTGQEHRMHSKTSGDGHFGRRSRPHKNMEQQRSQQRRRQRKEDVRLHVERLVKLWAEQFGIEAQVQQAIDIGQLKRNEDGSHDPSY